MSKYRFSNCLVSFIAVFLFFASPNVASNSPSDNTKVSTSDVGSLKGSFQVTPTGQAHYSIPIDVPPGTANMAPALSITYDSSSSNTHNGLLGMGFSLEGLTAITRCPSNKTQNDSIRGVDFTDHDKFCLSGEQLIAINGNYGADGAEYRTYTDSKVKIISYGGQGNGPDSFRVWTKDGKIAEYGFTSDSQVKAQGKKAVALWGLNRIQDTSGNYLEVHYSKDETQGNFYPTEINYTGNEKADPILIPYNSIKFIYESERPDTKITYQAGSKVTLDRRLKAIQVYQSSNLVYEYRLVYEISKNTSRSRITSIQKCIGSGVCLPPTKFEWQTNEEGWVEAPSFILPTDASIDGKDEGVRILDLNGDGLPDILQGSDKKPHNIWINTGKDWLKSDSFVLPTNILTEEKDTGVRIVDLNGDGLPDIIQGSDTTPHKTWINTGENWSETDDTNLILPMDILVEGKDDGVRFLDLNGDGLLDIVQMTPIEETRWKGAEDAHTNKFDFVYTLNEAEKRGDFTRSKRGWTIIYDLEQAAFIYRGDKFDYNRKPYATWINENGWIPKLNLNVPESVSRIAPYNRGIVFLDLNGDGLPDLVCGTSIGDNKQPNLVNGMSIDGDEQRKTWMNIEKYGWIESGFTLPANMLINGKYIGLKFLDLNGDGLPDIIQSYVDNSSKTEVRAAWLNTGNRWNKNSDFIFSTNIAENGQETGVNIVDLNGDGLPDIIQGHVAWLNTGKKWASTPNFNLPQNIASGIQYLDLNGDGLPDFIQSTSIDGNIVQSAYLNKAQKLPDYLIAVTDGLGAKLNIDYESLSSKKTDVYTRESDAQYPNIDWQGSMYVVYKISSSAAPNDPNVVDKTVANTTYHYTGAKFNHLGLGFLGFHMVTSTDQGTGINTTTIYNQDINLHTKGLPALVETRLANGTLISSLRNIWDCKTFGDDNVSTTYHSPYLKQSIKKTYELNGKLISTTGIDNSIDKHGNPTKIISSVQDATTKEIHTTITINAYHSDPKKWFLGELLAAQVTKIAPNGSEQKRASTFIYDPDTSLLIQSNAEPTDPNLALTTKYERDVFGNVISTTIYGKKIEPVKETEPSATEAKYDDQDSLAVKPNSPNSVVAQAIAPFDPLYLVKRTDYGHATAKIIKPPNKPDPGEQIEPIVTTVKYDDYGRFVIKATNPLNQSTYQTTDPRFGIVTESIDLNGLKTTYQYDDFARQVEQTAPDGVTTEIYYKWYDPKSIPAGEIQSVLKNCSYVVTSKTKNSTEQKEYFDVLGRKVASTTQNMDGKIIWQLTYYDELGRVTRTTQPFFAGDSIYLTEIKHDVLGRVIKSIFPDGNSSQIIYDGFTTTAINQLEQKQIKQVNALGELVKTTDNSGSETVYRYDAYGNMTAMIDSKNNISKIEYDNLGRKTAIYDKDKGHWSYQYDVLGNLISQTDALNNATTFKYDKLNRMVSRTEYAGIDQASTSTWEYDTAINGIGKLAKVNSVVDDKGDPNNLMLIHKARYNGLGAYTRSYSYDPLGRLSEEKTVIKDQTYVSGYTYDTEGRLDIETYPNGLQVKNNYNKFGYLVQISDAKTEKVYWSLNAKDALGRTTSESHSNGLITNYTYDPKTGFLTDIDTVLNTILSVQKDLLPELTGVTATHQHVDETNTANSSTAIQKETFNYDAVGNIKIHRDHINNMLESYKYDELNRLTKAESTGREALVLDYDTLGNITYKSDVGTYKYGENGAGHHAVTSIVSANGKPPATFQYNANGDQVSGSLNGEKRSITYTSYSKPLTIETPKARVSFLYDADHQKFSRVDKTGITYYLGNYEEVTIDDGKSIITQQKAYVGPNTIYIETKDSSDSENNKIEIYETLHNNLGSVTDITDANANVKQHFSYTPFGEQKLTKGEAPPHPITNKGFTGHETIEGANLIHMEGRIYDPVLGRFLSADPFVQDPSNSQCLNRYSYCINNPLAFVDPSGFGFWSSLVRSIGNFFGEVWDGIRNVGSAIWSGIKTVINSPIGRIAIGVVIGLTLGPVGGGLFGLNAGEGLLCLGEAMAIGGAATAAIGLATGNSLGQSLGEGFLAATIVGGIGKLAESYKASHDPGPITVPSPSNVRPTQQESGGETRTPRGDDFAGHSSGNATSPGNAFYSQNIYPSVMSDRADGNYSNGTKTPAYYGMFGSTANGGSPKITPEELTGRTPSDIRKMANDKSLRPVGDKLSSDYPRKWNDPVSNEQRLRIDRAHYENGKPYNIPEAARPHVHAYDGFGRPIKNSFGNSHFPLESEIESLAVGVMSRIFIGVTLLLYPQEAY